MGGGTWSTAGPSTGKPLRSSAPGHAPNLFTRGYMEDGNLHNKKAKVEEGTWTTTR